MSLPLPPNIRLITIDEFAVQLQNGTEITIPLRSFMQYQTLEKTVTAQEQVVSKIDQQLKIGERLLHTDIVRLKLLLHRYRQKRDMFINTCMETVSHLSQMDMTHMSPLFQKAVSSFYNGDIFEVISSLDDRKIEMDAHSDHRERARSIHYYRLKAQTYLLLSEYKKAEIYFEKNTFIYPSSETHSWYGQFYSNQKEYPKAVSQYEKALGFAQTPLEGAYLLHTLSPLLLKLNTINKAEASLKNALSLLAPLPQSEPDISILTAELHAELGNIMEARKEYSQADGWYKKALSIFETCEPKDTDIQEKMAKLSSCLASLTALRGDIVNAEKYFYSAISRYETLSKENPEFLSDLAHALLSQGQMRLKDKNYKGADTVFQKALKIFLDLADDDPAGNAQYVSQTFMQISALRSLQNNALEAQTMAELATRIQDALHKALTSPQHAMQQSKSLGEKALWSKINIKIRQLFRSVYNTSSGTKFAD